MAGSSSLSGVCRSGVSTRGDAGWMRPWPNAAKSEQPRLVCSNAEGRRAPHYCHHGQTASTRGSCPWPFAIPSSRRPRRSVASPTDRRRAGRGRLLRVAAEPAFTCARGAVSCSVHALSRIRKSCSRYPPARTPRCGRSTARPAYRRSVELQEIAVALARAYMEFGRQLGDAHYAGYAEAVTRALARQVSAARIGARAAGDHPPIPA